MSIQHTSKNGDRRDVRNLVNLYEEASIESIHDAVTSP